MRLCFVLFVLCLTAPVLGQVDLARNQPAAASSVGADGGNALFAVDGRPETRWESRWADDEWIYVDLGKHYTVERVVLRWDTAYGKRYVIELSDLAEHWAPLYTETRGNGNVDNLTGHTGTGRYVRMRGLERGTALGYSLQAFEVYGHQPGAPRAAFITPLTPVYARELVPFDASATTDAQGDALTHHWDFGDGTFGEGVRTAHAYATPGTYTITYTATDQTGAADVLQRPIVIQARPFPKANVP